MTEFDITEGRRLVLSRSLFTVIFILCILQQYTKYIWRVSNLNLQRTEWEIGNRGRGGGQLTTEQYSFQYLFISTIFMSQKEWICKNNFFFVFNLFYCWVKAGTPWRLILSQDLHVSLIFTVSVIFKFLILCSVLKFCPRPVFMLQILCRGAGCVHYLSQVV